MPRPLVVLDAPSNLGLSPSAPGREPGVWRLPQALRSRRIVERLGALDGGSLPAPAYSPEWFPGFGVRNGEAIAAFTRALARKVGSALADERFPLVLGGDCSILLGNALALRRRGRFGLVFLDGHLDFRHPGNALAVGAAAGEDLALVTGRGSDRLTNIDGLRPYVRDEDIVALAEREHDPDAADVAGTDIVVWDLQHVRTLGAGAVGRQTVERMRALPIDGFWIHFDADALDDAVMPAVDSPQPDGLSYGELVELVAPMLRSGLAVGMEVTIFDPELDPGGQVADEFTDALVHLFAEAGWPSLQT